MHEQHLSLTGGAATPGGPGNPGDLENPTVKKILNEIVSSNVHQLFLNTEFIVKQHYNLFEITTVL